MRYGAESAIRGVGIALASCWRTSTRRQGPSLVMALDALGPPQPVSAIRAAPAPGAANGSTRDTLQFKDTGSDRDLSMRRKPR